MARRRSFATVALFAAGACAPAVAQPTPAGQFEVQAPHGSFEPARQSVRTSQLPRPEPGRDIAAPDLPPVIVTIEPIPQPPYAKPEAESGERTAGEPTIHPPDLPQVMVVIDTPAPQPFAEATPAPISDAVGAATTAEAPALRNGPDIAPPSLPDVTVVIEAPGSGRAASLQPADLRVPLADAIRARIDQDGALTHPRLSRALRDDIVAFYAQRNHAPLFVGADGLNVSGRAVVARLLRADEDGLEPSTYAVAGLDADAGPAALAALELNLSVAAVMYARDARGGRIDARRLSSLIDPTLDLPAPGEALHMLSAARDAGSTLQMFNPPHEGYRALRAKLREARTGAERIAAVSIPQGPVLRVGMSDARVALVRERLKVAPQGDFTYDEAVAEAVTSFQRARGLTANGQLTRRTVAALSAASTPRVQADIIANMERWRWLPRELGDRHLIVNIPEYMVRVVHGGAIEHQARVIVGRPDTPTPIFSDTMQFLVVNPSWFVPPSILKKEFLPKLASDPTYAERRGYEVTRRGGQVSVRQPPGERNALGHIKFMFPNRHAVYLHDTPTRHLFGSDRRAFSHGCVRVDQPFRLAEIVLGKDRGWTEGRVRSLVGRGEQSVRMEQKLQIHLTYFTAHVDELGRLQQRDDIYGYDRRLRAALGLDG